MPTRRHAGVLVAVLLMLAPLAHAQTWPSRAVTLVVPFAAGSASDTLARILTIRMSEVLGQQVVIENVGGAGGMTGVARVAKAPPDGYQFVLGGLDTFAQIQTLYKRPLYSATTDFAPVALAVDMPLVLLARKELPVHSLQEFIAYAKANQGKMQFGSAGVGSGSHLACARLNLAMGIEVTHVPYRGSGPAMQDLVGGRLDYFCALGAAAVPQIAGNNARGLAVLTREPSPLFANIRTAHEQGLTDFDAYFWSAFFVPAGTPQPVVQRLHDAVVATLDTPAVQQRLKEVGVSVVPADRRSPDHLRRFLQSEIDKWAATIKSAGITLD